MLKITCLPWAGMGWITYGHKGIIWGNGYVLCLDCGYGYMDIKINQKSLKYTLKISIFIAFKQYKQSQ